MFIPLSGWAADRFGARTVFRAAIIVFTVGLCACGFASSLFDFVLFRIVQGIGGAMMVPVGRLVILRTVPKSELISALAWLTIPARWARDRAAARRLHHHLRLMAVDLWINIPIGFLGVILATYYIQNFREEELPPLDVKGFILSGVGLSGLAFGFTTIGQDSFPAVVAALLIVGFIGCFLCPSRPHRDRTASISACSRSIRFLQGVGGFIYRVASAPRLCCRSCSSSASASRPFNPACSRSRPRRRHRHENHGGADPAPLRIQTGVLVINAVSAIFIGVPAMFTPITPHGLILCCSGRRLLQVAAFTSINTLAYADIEPGDERGDELCQRRAAIIDVGRRRRRRAGARDPASRTRGHGGAGERFHHGLRRGRPDLRRVGLHLHATAEERREPFGAKASHRRRKRQGRRG